jgi:cobalt-zinc-cadmium efflux system outer membrane protein
MHETRPRENKMDAVPGTHPQLAPLEQAIGAARARLDLAAKNVRDMPELTIGVRRERPLQDTGWESSTIIGVRIPLATDARNRPKIAAANADLIEAEALLPYEQGRIDAEREAAGRDLERADESLARAETRRHLAAEMRREYARAFTLGNIDLPQRLRIEADAFDAELSAARARIEAARSISRYNQALGILP